MKLEQHYLELAAENIALKAERGELNRRIAELERENALLNKRIRVLMEVREMELQWAKEEMQEAV